MYAPARTKLQSLQRKRGWQLRYISSDERDEAIEADRNRIPRDRIAGHLGITVEELNQVLGIQQKPAANMVAQPADYLWAADKLEGVL